MFLLFSVGVWSGDPSTTWEAFAVYKAPPGKNVTLVSGRYTVPAPPETDDGTTPKWWVGLQSTDGMGVLMKPQLTWGNRSWIINTEVLDYSLRPSVKHLSRDLIVFPGDVIDASVEGDIAGVSPGKVPLRQRRPRTGLPSS